MTQQTESSSSNVPSQAQAQAPQIRYESLNSRVLRQFKAHPLVPLGMFATVFALVGATIGFHKGDSRTMQNFLRFRVAAQGFTVLAAVSVPIYYQINRYVNNKQK